MSGTISFTDNAISGVGGNLVLNCDVSTNVISVQNPIIVNGKNVTANAVVGNHIIFQDAIPDGSGNNLIAGKIGCLDSTPDHHPFCLTSELDEIYIDSKKSYINLTAKTRVVINAPYLEFKDETTMSSANPLHIKADYYFADIISSGSNGMGTFNSSTLVNIFEHEKFINRVDSSSHYWNRGNKVLHIVFSFQLSNEGMQIYQLATKLIHKKSNNEEHSSHTSVELNEQGLYLGSTQVRNKVMFCVNEYIEIKNGDYLQLNTTYLFSATSNPTTFAAYVHVVEL